MISLPNKAREDLMGKLGFAHVCFDESGRGTLLKSLLELIDHRHPILPKVNKADSAGGSRGGHSRGGGICSNLARLSRLP